MQWKLKCLAFRVLEMVPMRETMLKLSQKLITGRYFEKIDDETFDAYNTHVVQFKKSCPGGVVLEFGSGRNFIAPLLLSHAGASKIHCYDLNRLARIDQIQNAVEQLSARLGGNWPQITDFDELAEKYRIHYFSPGDARDTKLQSSSVDFVYSTSTLEHIPEQSIKEILVECMRVIRPSGVFSFIIDYHDHYATADPDISMFNFYTYSEDQWRRYNPDIHFQNRLRHSDYQRIFTEVGLKIIKDIPIFQDWSKTAYNNVVIHQNFEKYSATDLQTGSGVFVLKA